MNLKKNQTETTEIASWLAYTRIYFHMKTLNMYKLMLSNENNMREKIPENEDFHLKLFTLEISFVPL